MSFSQFKANFISNLFISFITFELSIIGVGNALSTRLQVSGVGSVNSISPSGGSINGGTQVTISGNGFDSIDNTLVVFGSSPCQITSVSVTSLTCITSSSAAGQVNVQTM